MPSGSCARLEELPDVAREVVDQCRRATLSTISEDGMPATVPVCFALDEGRVIIAIDEKPKATKELARVRNVRRDPRVTLMFDKWDEDWTRLAWVMVKGHASVEQAGDLSPLLARYEQYRAEPPGGPLLVIEPRRVRWWSWQ